MNHPIQYFVAVVTQVSETGVPYLELCISQHPVHL